MGAFNIENAPRPNLRAQELLVRGNRPTQAEPTHCLCPSRTLPTAPFHFPAPPRTAQHLLFPGDVALAVAVVRSPALVFVPPARSRPAPSTLLRERLPSEPLHFPGDVARAGVVCARARRVSASAPSPVSLSPFLDLFCYLR
jgi:hypothetical protein